ncbi:kinase-like domain-containing protein [Mycena albidolilacea]|uniref:Kinase-like domain-containing protein n=1 Tax=Mycena albidolilacea TaxID=1033008 RepID=A0AAD7EFZ4_9AGAR|nr:kinase-like domain-containing protein [Mycena albidolilacea]
MSSSIFRTSGVDYDYSRVNYIHRGADGNVYKAIDMQTSRVVAIRVLEMRDPYDLYTPADLVRLQEDFVERVNLAVTLHHPHVVEILAVYYKGATNRQNLVARELMAGGTLSDYLSRVDERQWRDKVYPMGVPHDVCRDMAYQLCQAVAYMHGLGICHRNLTLETILIKSNDPLFIKVSGLGWAERYEPSNMRECFGPRSPGWYEYLAPETALSRPLDHHTDIRADSWGVGIILFRMLLLKTPWRELKEDFNMASDLRWNELETCLRPAPPPSELQFPDSIPYEVLSFAADGIHTVYGSPSAEYDQKIRYAHDGVPSANGLSLSPEGHPLTQRRLLGPDRSEAFEACLDLLRQFLRDAPEKRLSVREALDHPWLKIHTPVNPNVVEVEEKARL